MIIDFPELNVNKIRGKFVVKREPKRFITWCLTLGLIVALTLGGAACSTKSAATFTPAETLSNIIVTPASTASLVVGSSEQFTAKGTYSDGSTVDISSQVTWSCSNDTLATINSNGLTTGDASGTANITAALSGIVSPPVSLTVISLSSITVTPVHPANLLVGSSLHFTAEGTYSDGSTADISSKVTWASSDPTIVVISSDGIVTGAAAGLTNITASMLGINSPAIPLTMKLLSSIAILPASSINLTTGSTLQLTAIGTYSDGSTLDISSQVSWFNDATKVVSISSTGLATGLAAGNANIRATLHGVTSSYIYVTVGS
jgi:hypothetical protein